MKQIKNIDDLYVVGVNFRKADAAVRGGFALSTIQYQQILQNAAHFGVDEFFVLSTCNRTEIIGFAKNSKQLVDLLCTEINSSSATFYAYAYVKNGKEVLSHLFNVAAGLDSQLLGDYEIVGQLKLAVKQSKQYGCMGTFLERLVNTALQSSKQIKNKTALCAGTVSVAFAAVQYLKETEPDIATKSILLLGTGKIGSSTCKNIVDYLGIKRITLINRTIDKALQLANVLQLQAKPINKLAQEIKEADIIVVATSAAQPTILKNHLINVGNKIIIDLSIPCNVEPAAQQLPNISFVNVDEISTLKDKTLAARKAAVPEAKKIIAHHTNEFLNWYTHRIYIISKKINNCQSTALEYYSKHRSMIAASKTLPEQNDDNCSSGNTQSIKGSAYLEATNLYIQVSSN